MTTNQKVGGSNPFWHTIDGLIRTCHCQNGLFGFVFSTQKLSTIMRENPAYSRALSILDLLFIILRTGSNAPVDARPLAKPPGKISTSTCLRTCSAQRPAHHHTESGRNLRSGFSFYFAVFRVYARRPFCHTRPTVCSNPCAPGGCARVRVNVFLCLPSSPIPLSRQRR